MKFVSTRGEETVSSFEAVVRGMAGGGALFVPERFPEVSKEELSDMLPLDYPERASLILGKYFDEYDREGLLSALRTAFDKFEGSDPAPLVRMESGIYMLELFHGPTCASSDLSLGVFPYLLKEGRALLGQRRTCSSFPPRAGTRARPFWRHSKGRRA